MVHVEARTVAAEKFKSNLCVRKIVRTGENALSFLDNMQASSQWAPDTDPRSVTGIQVSTHELESCGKFYFKLEGVLHVDMIYILAALMEVDLYHSWVPFCSKAECLSGEDSPFRKVVRLMADMTILKREAVISRSAN